MNRLIAFILGVALLCATPVVHAQQPVTIEGELDIDSGSPALDLAPGVPLAVELFKMAGLYFQGEAIAHRLNTQIESLVNEIAPSLSARGGYLLRVNLYVNEHGVVEIPGGQLLSIVGPGVNPIDALAENIRGGSGYNAPVRGGLRNSSQYIWIRRADGRLVGQMFSKDVSRVLTVRGHNEADVRRLDDGYYRAATDVGLSTAFANAGYWADMESGRLNLFRSEATANQVRAFTRRIKELQDNANRLQGEYEKLLREIAAAQEKARILEKASAVTDLVSSATDLSSALSSGGAAVKPTPKGDVPFESAEAQTKFLTKKIETGTAALEYQKTEILRYRTEIDTLDLKLQNTYQTEGIPLPPRR
jgi:hypothetical protein